MIIPIKCFTCGNVLADKYRYYQEQVIKQKMESAKTMSEEDQHRLFNMVYLTKENAKKSAEGNVLDSLGLKNVCCRRHMLTHVNIE